MQGFFCLLTTGNAPLPRSFSLLIGILFLSFAVNAQTSVSNSVEPNRFEGYLTMRIEGYAVDGIPDRYEPFTWLISGTPTLYLGGIKMPLRIQAGNLGINRFGQPFNKFGISPTGSWWKLHFGHSNLNWSPFTLGGRTFLGGGFELNPGKLRLGFIYGLIQKSIEEYSDTLLDKPPLVLFERKGFAARVGIGNQRNYADLIFLKAWDDTASITTKPVPAFATPQDNAVIGFSSRHQLAPHLRLHLDGAVSAYNQNTQSKEQDLEDNFWSRSLKPIFTPRYASRYSGAAEILLNYQRRNFGIGLHYKRVDADYQSMGAWFLQHDVENSTIRLNLASPKSKIRLDANYGYQRNNLTHLHASNTLRQIAQVNLQFIPAAGQFYHLQYFNYTTELRRRRELLEDTLALNQLTQHWNAGGQWKISRSQPGDILQFEGFYRNLQDQAHPKTDLYRSYGFTASYLKQFSHFSFGGNFYLDQFRFNAINFLRLQPGLTLMLKGMKRRLDVSARTQVGFTYRESVLQSTSIMPGLIMTLRASDWHTLSLIVNLIRYDIPDQIQDTAFTESRGSISYTYRLH
ncbi:MAG TPA: hypothetical protein VJ508_01345 [Saprospiraceae bacterium]|nr:hypothetical protein [Saprospiraceae bacterium]